MSTVSLCYFWECEGMNESINFDLSDHQDNDEMANTEDESTSV